MQVKKSGARLVSYGIGLTVAAIALKGGWLYYDHSVNGFERWSHEALPGLLLAPLLLVICWLVERNWLVIAKFTGFGLLMMSVTIGVVEAIERSVHANTGEWFTPGSSLALFWGFFSLLCVAMPYVWVNRGKLYS